MKQNHVEAAEEGELPGEDRREERMMEQVSPEFIDHNNTST